MSKRSLRVPASSRAVGVRAQAPQLQPGQVGTRERADQGQHEGGASRQRGAALWQSALLPRKHSHLDSTSAHKEATWGGLLGCMVRRRSQHSKPMLRRQEREVLKRLAFWCIMRMKRAHVSW